MKQYEKDNFYDAFIAFDGNIAKQYRIRRI